MTNPISQNLTPTLKAHVVGFPKHADVKYAWSIANPLVGGTLQGSGKSIQFDMYLMTVGGTVDIVLHVSSDARQTAWCDVEVERKQSQPR
jgi:hypothetical protein